MTCRHHPNESLEDCLLCEIAELRAKVERLRAARKADGEQAAETFLRLAVVLRTAAKAVVQKRTAQLLDAGADDLDAMAKAALGAEENGDG